MARHTSQYDPCQEVDPNQDLWGMVGLRLTCYTCQLGQYTNSSFIQPTDVRYTGMLCPQLHVYLIIGLQENMTQCYTGHVSSPSCIS